MTRLDIKNAVCERCRSKLSGDKLMDGMAKMRRNRIRAFVCRDCLTLGEVAEMAVREATTVMDYTADGRFFPRLKLEGMTET